MTPFGIRWIYRSTAFVLLIFAVQSIQAQDYEKSEHVDKVKHPNGSLKSRTITKTKETISKSPLDYAKHVEIHTVEWTDQRRLVRKLRYRYSLGRQAICHEKLWDERLYQGDDVIRLWVRSKCDKRTYLEVAYNPDGKWVAKKRVRRKRDELKP